MSTDKSNDLYIVGVGPGDPELMTVKAVKLLNEADTLVVPKGRENGESAALNIISSLVSLEGKEVVEIYFPMHKVYKNGKSSDEVGQAWNLAALTILEKMSRGKVVFPTLGDPALYSTGFYVYATLMEIHPDINIKIVPGITAMANCSAATATPLCLGGELLSVVPATFNNERLGQILETFDTIVLMKVHRVMDRLVTLLDSTGLLENALLVERSGQPDERIFTDVREAARHDLHYFSTIIVRKDKPVQS